MRHNAQSGAQMPFDRVVTLFCVRQCRIVCDWHYKSTKNNSNPIYRPLKHC
nr:MAG TPA: hypothetical protein [Caudoviricetes sp.]